MKVLITGGAGLLATEHAIALAEYGAKVYLSDFNIAKCEEAVDKLKEMGINVIALHGDVTSKQSWQDTLDTIQKNELKIDILVNNAAIAQEKPFLNITDFEWDEMLKSNLSGPFTCIQEVLPEMIEMGWGRIVNIASVGGQWGGINQIHYASAKAGLIGLTRSIAKTFSIYGITCNAISPGLIKTDMSASELTTESGKEKIKHIPVGRLGIPEDIASSVSYLVSDEASYVTGQTINLNGGMYFG
jgi:acetoacetyl-CoA reductase/3-oxoacyl-[acyl-carrier protein] reductase